MLANNGAYLRAVFGQSLHLAGENPYVDPGVDPSLKFNYSPVSGLETNRSDYVAGIYLSPTSGISLLSQSRFDERDWSLRRQDAAVTASYGPVAGALNYTYTAFDPVTGLVDKQHELMASLALRLTDHWTVQGTVRYDLDASTRIQDILSLKYGDECFVLTASYIETNVTNAALDLKPDRTVMLRFELKHIGEFNYKTDQLSHVFGDQRGTPIQ